jgi:hypothetical protein
MAVVAGAIGDPRLVLTRCERDGHERRAQIVGAEALTRCRSLVELRLLDTDAAKVVADLIGQVLDGERHAVFGEDVVPRLRMGPALSCPSRG